MSKTSIPVNVRRDLWFDAHGRCELCNKPLYRDEVTMMDVNLSEYAHIIADSPKGPRGDEELSPLLAQDKSNLILLCKDHHKMIDDAGGVQKYGVQLLRDIKRAHEERIDIVTGIAPNQKSQVVCYTPVVGDRHPSVTRAETFEALFPDYYPMTLEPIRLEATNLPYNDSSKMYWEFQPDILKENFNKFLADKIKDLPKLSLFAIAPQPLLTLLGTYIGDMYNVDVMQRHRIPAGVWKWLDEDVDNPFRVIPPEDKSKAPVLIFAISGTEIIERVQKQMGEEYSYWIFTCAHPDNDMMRTKSQLAEFHKLLRTTINEINTIAADKSIKIFPAMPISCAIELGRTRLPKTDNPWEMYDKPTFDSEYVKTITIR